jgi:hypothetical protein
MAEDNAPANRDRTRRRPGYSVLAVGLYEEEVRIADHLAATLRASGWPQPNRSLVIREALRHLHEHLLDKRPEDVLQYFVDRQTRRLIERTRPSKNVDWPRRPT